MKHCEHKYSNRYPSSPDHAKLFIHAGHSCRLHRLAKQRIKTQPSISGHALIDTRPWPSPSRFTRRSCSAPPASASPQPTSASRPCAGTPSAATHPCPPCDLSQPHPHSRCKLGHTGATAHLVGCVAGGALRSCVDGTVVTAQQLGAAQVRLGQYRLRGAGGVPAHGRCMCATCNGMHL